MKLSVLRSNAKLFLGKEIGPHFLSLNCVKISVGVPFCYRMSLERIRRLRKLTIFLQVHLKSEKNVMLSQAKTFD